MNRRVPYFLLLVVFLSFSPGYQAHADMAGKSATCRSHYAQLEDFFPLAPGACWIYKGYQRTQVGSVSPGGERNGGLTEDEIRRGVILEEEKVELEEGKEMILLVKKEEIMAMMEVVDAVRRDGVVGYLVKGNPGGIGSDVEAYIILEPDKLFRAKPESLDKIKDENDSLFALVQDYEQIFIDLPLIPGKKYGGIEQIFRTDSMYCWLVDRIESTAVDSIAGSPLPGQQPEFVLAYRTLPDHVEIRMVPGLGITSYKYVHHGSITETATQLIHYYPGAWPEKEKQN